VAITGNPDSPLARVARDVLIAASPDGYLQPADLSARHCQLFVVDLLYLLVAQMNFGQTTRLLAASAAAVAPRRRPMRGNGPLHLSARWAAPHLSKEPSGP
jgi:DNA-binding MurR/RpiR family transcriptional regulator